MRRWLLAAVVLLAAAIAVLQDAPPVAAHALLARADPPINAALRESPSAVSVFMTEPAAARLQQRAGARQQRCAARHRRHRILRRKRDADARQRLAAAAGRLHGRLAKRSRRLMGTPGTAPTSSRCSTLTAARLRGLEWSWSSGVRGRRRLPTLRRRRSRSQRSCCLWARSRSGLRPARCRPRGLAWSSRRWRRRWRSASVWAC